MVCGIRHHFTDRYVRTPDTCRHSTRSNPLHIDIIKITLRDKHQPLSMHIIRMETTRSKQQTVVTVVSWCLVLEHKSIEN
jgi:hypothetical protein